jgi:hypothetical protein
VDKCPDCGLSLPSDASFCPTCGWRSTSSRSQGSLAIGPAYHPAETEEPSPWRPYLALAAFGIFNAVAWVAYWIVLTHAPHWARHDILGQPAAYAAFGVVVVAIAVEVASVIHPPTARRIEAQQYRAPDHWEPGMRRRTELGPLAKFMLVYAFGAAFVLVFFLVRCIL